MQEPRDGDFVAYIEALQRESAARLARQGASVLDGGAPRAAADHFFEPKDATSKPAGIEGTVERFTRRDADAKAVKAIVAGMVGAVVLLTALGSGSPLAFIVGVALLFYAVPRLLAVFNDRVRRASNRSAVEHAFGRSSAPTRKSEP